LYIKYHLKHAGILNKRVKFRCEIGWKIGIFIYNDI
jgi:hypothetical protein